MDTLSRRRDTPLPKPHTPSLSPLPPVYAFPAYTPLPLGIPFPIHPCRHAAPAARLRMSTRPAAYTRYPAYPYPAA